MNTDKKVSVIIPNYNYAQYVGQAINSVLNQTYSNIEIVVVNNGSTDNSLDILKGFGDRICLVNQENLGQSGARKSGLSRATGDFIAFLDADDMWDPKKIEKQIMEVIPEKDWGEIGMAISFLGRETCRPTHPQHHDCVMAKHCDYFKTNH